MATTLLAPIDQPAVRSARLGLGIFLALVVVLSIPMQWGIIATDAFAGSSSAIFWVLGLMSVPTVASVVARLSLHEGFTDVSFRFNGRRGWSGAVRAVAIPVLVAGVSFGFAWATGLADLTTPSLQPWLATITANLVLNLILVPGEEIGWRGYMVTRLIDAGVPHAVLVGGVIWGLWHVPLVLWGGYIQGTPSPLLSAWIFMIAATSVGYLLARLRLDTGSIWPTVVLHVAMNTVIQAVFAPATSGADHAIWVGEAGIITAVVLLVVAVGVHARRPAAPRGS